jgi:hypothetical protein
MSAVALASLRQAKDLLLFGVRNFIVHFFGEGADIWFLAGAKLAGDRCPSNKVPQTVPTEPFAPKDLKKGIFGRQSVGPFKVCSNRDNHIIPVQSPTYPMLPPLACFKFRFVSSPHLARAIV